MVSLIESIRNYGELATSFSDSAVALGTFRHLSNIAQHFVMTFLFIDKIEERHLAYFVDDPNLTQKAIYELRSLHIFLTDGNTVRVNPEISKPLKLMLSDGPTCNLRIKHKPDRRRPTPEVIALTSEQQWKKLIDFLIGLGNPPSINTLRLLFRSGLISQIEGDWQRTAKCFQFLLSTRENQLSQLLSQYLEEVPNKVAFFTLLHNLSIAKLNQDYSVKNIDKNVLIELQELGLIYRYNSKSKRFYIAPVTLGLLTDTERPSPQSDKFLTVETNFRVYAYTQQDIHIVLLSYFLQLEYRLPNLVIGFLTRDSVFSALREGLSASQIIRFLRDHSRTGKIPDNVEDQVMLWENERKRVEAEDAFMLDEFVDMSLYRSTLLYAQSTGAYIWDSPERRVIILYRAKATPVLEYLYNLQRS